MQTSLAAKHDKDFVAANMSAKGDVKESHSPNGRHVLHGAPSRNGAPVLHNSFAEHHEQFVLASDALKKVHYEITRLARLDFDVLIVGETGVGKDLAAFEIHQRSARRGHPFVSVSLRSLSPTLIESELFGHERGAFSGAERTHVGKLEAANGGTVYIPEISSLTEEVQLKLLHFMQYKTITRVGQDNETQLDVRVIMATNENLEELVRRGTMREDFYYRICGVALHIPPLREHRESIKHLAEYFLDKLSSSVDGKAYSLHPDVLAAFESYQWHGNVRELRNAITSAIVHATDSVLRVEDFQNLSRGDHCDAICTSCFAAKFPSLPEYHIIEKEFKRSYFEEALKRANNNYAAAARIAGMTPQGFRKTLHALQKELCTLPSSPK